MPEDRPTRRTVGYALNVFPYDTLADLWPVLEGEVLQIKETAFPDEVFPVELRFSDRLVRELSSDCDHVAKLKYFLDTHDLALVTVNGFVMPAFHGEPVKERVYLPAWHESDARLRFTNACVDLLAQLAPVDAEFVSVSVPFGALKPVTMDMVAGNILKAGEHAARQNGVVALEPEPGLCVETTGEVIEFFERFVPDRLRPHLAVNFDLSHQLVQFEQLGASIRQLQATGIRIAKVHISNAAEMTTLTPFYDDSIYLHQVCGVDAGGERAFFSLDWPATPPPAGIARYRCHYHLPVCPPNWCSSRCPSGTSVGEAPETGATTPPPSTLVEVEHFLTHLPSLHHSIPLIIETYTWPEHLRGRGQLVENICRELAWVQQRICLSEPEGTV
jgi:hypothetical protein